MSRFVDILTSICIILAISPVLLYFAGLSYFKTRHVFCSRHKVGYQGRLFLERTFACDGFGKKLPLLFNLLCGDLTWVGVRALTPEEAQKLPASLIAEHYKFKPGLISAYRLRHHVGLAYDDEFSIDHEFSAKASFKDRLGLCLRAIVALLLAGGKELETPTTLHFWGIDIANTTMNDAIDWIGQQVSQKKKCLLAFVNPACLNIAYTDQDYRRVLQHADRVLPDGIGIKLGCRLLNQSLIANVNGTDLFPRLCKQASEQGYSLFLLGGLPGVAEKTAAAMKEQYPDLLIGGIQDGFFKAEEEDEIIERINQSGACVLLAGFGVPKQELWLERRMDKLNPMVCMGVGGLFDYYSGRIPRAPLWMREIGLEWLWRLYQEPGRMWRRYLVGNPLFLYRVWRQRRQG